MIHLPQEQSPNLKLKTEATVRVIQKIKWKHHLLNKIFYVPFHQIHHQNYFVVVLISSKLFQILVQVFYMFCKEHFIDLDFSYQKDQILY